MADPRRHDDLAKAKAAFQHWRETRTALGPIPKALWTAAAQLARKHGRNRVARELGLHRGALNRHIDNVSRPPAKKQPPRPRFVELPPSLPGNVGPSLGSAARSATVVEVVGTDGARLIIRLGAESAGDVAQLVAAFRRAPG